jgi:hypothetical protein
MPAKKKWTVYSFASHPRGTQTHSAPVVRKSTAAGRVLETVVLRVLGIQDLHALVLLGAVNRRLRALLRHSHPWLREVFERRFHWDDELSRCLKLSSDLIHNPTQMWRPQRAWRHADVPPEERGAFNAYVWRATVLSTVMACSVCRRWAGGPTALVLWALTLRLCPDCAADKLISHRVLWHEYGLWLRQSMPADERWTTQVPECMRSGSVLDYLLDTCFAFPDYAAPEHRVWRSRSVHDLAVPGTGRRRGPAVRRPEYVLFFWRPHVERVLRLDRTYVARRAAAGATLMGYVLRWAMHRTMRRLAHCNKESVEWSLAKRQLRVWTRGALAAPPLLPGHPSDTQLYGQGTRVQPLMRHDRVLREAWDL